MYNSREELKGLFSPISWKSTIFEPLFYRCRDGESRVPQLPDNYLYYSTEEAPFDEYRKRLEAIRVFFDPMPDGAELRLWARIMVYPVYPASPLPFDGHKALRGILRSDGSLLAARVTRSVGDDRKPFVTVRQTGLDGAVWKFRYRHTHWKGQVGELIDLPGAWNGERYVFDATAGPKSYSIVLVTNDPKTGEELQFYGPHIYN